MARKPGSKKSTKKPGRKAKPAKKAATRKAAPKKAAKKATAGKAAKKAAKKPARKAGKSPAQKASKAAARKPTKKASTKSPRKGDAARLPGASGEKPASAPKLPAHRPLTAGVVLRSRTGGLPRGAERNAGKPGRAQRKVNLRTGVARPSGARPPGNVRRPDGPWPIPGEPASEMALRERILVCILAAEDRLAGRDAADSPVDAETAARCLDEMRGWLSASATLRDGRTLDRLLFESLVADELAMLRETIGADAFDSRRFADARLHLLELTAD